MLALAEWQKGDKDAARTWFDKAVSWTKRENTGEPDLRRLWKRSGRPARYAGTARCQN